MAIELYGPRDVYHIEPRLSYSTYPEDQYEQHVVDPRYTRHMQTRYLRKPVEIRCCDKCMGRIVNAVQTLPGVEGVLFDGYDEVLKIIGSADDAVIHQAVKYARKGNPGHHHFWPRKIRLLSSSRASTYYPSTRYAPSWNQPVRYRVSHYDSSYTPSYLYDDEASWRYADAYGPASFGYAAQSPYSTYYSPGL
ncbi:unnamed protein product [Sphagnum balticum]